MTALLPRATLGEVLRGEARLVGSRLDPARPRGVFSPIEARVSLGLVYEDLAAAEARALAAGSAARAGAALRGLLAAALAPPAGAARAERPFVVGARVDALTVEEALAAILAPAPRDRARVVHFVHPHALNVAAGDAELRGRYARADAVLPDGVGLRLGARLLGHALPHNLNGTDLLPLLCARAAAAGRPLALVGAAPGVADACAERLRAATPGLEIPLTSHGFLDDEASAALAQRIGALAAPVVLVGMGTPLQERWVWRHLAGVGGATALTVGGLFDFFSGRVPRAPMVLRELGLEWAFRLAQEPRRLARRYLAGNPLFLARVVRQRLSGDARG